MSRVIYHTATTLNGFLADDQDSLEWLFVVAGAQGAESEFSKFLKGVGALIMGSTTYEWLLAHENLLEQPEKWYYQGMASFVMSSRTLEPVATADIRFRSGSVTAVWDELRDAAGEGDIWIVGGGDLVGQFADEGLLDEIRVSVAPVTLESGKPLLPRRIESDRLTLESVRQAGQFAELTYSVHAKPSDG